VFDRLEINAYNTPPDTMQNAFKCQQGEMFEIVNEEEKQRR